MLIMGGADSDPGKDSNKLANRTVLVQVCLDIQMLWFLILDRIKYVSYYIVFCTLTEKTARLPTDVGC